MIAKLSPYLKIFALLMALIICTTASIAQTEIITPGPGGSGNSQPGHNDDDDDESSDDSTPVHESYSLPSGSDNRNTLGNQLNELRTINSDDMRSLLAILDTLPDEQVRDALDQISPAGNDVLTDAAIISGRLVMETLTEHMRDSHEDRSSEERDNGKDGFNGKSGHEPLVTTWVAGILASYDDDGKEPEYPDSYEYETMGFTAGADIDILPNLIVGIEGGLSETAISWKSSGGDGDIGAYHGGMYGRVPLGNAYVEIAIDHALNNYDNNRAINFGGTSRHAKSEHDGSQTSAYMSGGYKFKWNKLQVSPVLSVQQTYLAEDAYNEKGAGDLNLNMGKQSEDSMQSVLGFDITHKGRIKLVGIESRLRTKWSHEYNTEGRTIDASFAEAGGSSFSVTGPEGDSDHFQLGGGVTARFVGTAAFLNFDIILDGGNIVSEMINIGTRTTF